MIGVDTPQGESATVPSPPHVESNLCTLNISMCMQPGMHLRLEHPLSEESYTPALARGGTCTSAQQRSPIVMAAAPLKRVDCQYVSNVASDDSPRNIALDLNIALSCCSLKGAT